MAGESDAWNLYPDAENWANCVTTTEFEDNGNTFMSFDEDDALVSVDGAQTDGLEGYYEYKVTVNDDYEFSLSFEVISNPDVDIATESTSN